MKRHFKNVYLFFFAWVAVEVYGKTLWLLWFKQNGASLLQLTLYFLLLFLTPVLVIKLLKHARLPSRTSLLLGILASMLSYPLLLFLVSPVQMYLAGILGGLGYVFFWAAYNTLFFEASHRHQYGITSGLYFLAPAMLGVGLPLFSGLVAKDLGFPVLIATAALLYIIPLALVHGLENFTVSYDIGPRLSGIRVKTLLFLEGFFEAGVGVIVPITALRFLQQPLDLGVFFGVLAAAAGLANMMFTHYSDKFKQRKAYFYVFSIGAIVSFITLSFIHDTFAWEVVTGITNFFVVLASAFWLALPLDHLAVPIRALMVSREFLLNLGRALGALIIVGSVAVTGNLQAGFMAIGFLSLAYPITAYYQRIYRTGARGV